MFKQSLLTLALASLLAVTPLTSAKTVEDIKGNPIELADDISRVADLWHANNQIVLLLGGADKLVATTTNIQKSAWFNQIYPRIQTVPALTNGQNVQLEALLEVQPQAVLLSSPTMLEEVNRAGLKGVLVNFQDFAGLRKTVQITAAVLGGEAPQIAQDYLAELDGNLALVAERLQNLDDSARPTVIHIANANNLLQIDGGQSMIGDWILKAGGKNALPEQKNLVDVSMEEIIAQNPEVIIIGGDPNVADAIAKIYRDPAWQSIAAVKNQRVYANPTGVFKWDRYSAEAALQILWAAKLLHPQQFKDIDMVTKTQAFYQKYYRYTLSEANAKQILQGLDPLPNE